ncbi:MAG: YraN family protein [Gemmatimonadota bacterium]
MERKPLGDWGERSAAQYLERRGWTILDRKFRAGRKEIDLVARRGEVVAFVEVKTRVALGYGHPFESIGPRKRRQIASTAQAWIDRFGDGDSIFRFDAVAVTRSATGGPEIEHLEDAWGL